MAAVADESLPRPENHHHQPLADRTQGEIPSAEVAVERPVEPLQEGDAVPGEGLLAVVGHQVVGGLLYGETLAEFPAQGGGALRFGRQGGLEERPSAELQRTGVGGVQGQHPPDEGLALLT